jgi:protein-S-isoprenylcysteine O-methyltransferase Ste14
MNSSLQRSNLMVNKKGNGHTSKRQLNSPVLTVICLMIMILLSWLWPILRILRFSLSLVGVLIGGSGLAICFTAHRQFEKIGTTLYPFNEPEKLVTDGLFRYCRNPMYLGLTIFLAGAGWLLGCLSPFVVVAAFLLIADRWYVAYEERRLAAVFGKAYTAYRARTPRWL